MITTMETRRVPVEMLKPARYNPRVDLQPGDPAYEKIKRSLDEYGYVDPLIWNEVTGNIVGGHETADEPVETGEAEAPEKPADAHHPDESVPGTPVSQLRKRLALIMPSEAKH